MIGEKIKNARIKAKMTQKELGEKCNMADSAIRRYENNRAHPKIETIIKIAKALNIPPSDLLSDVIYVTNEEKERFSEAAKAVDPARLAEANKQSKENLNKRKREQLLSNYDKVNEDGKEKIFEDSKDIASNPNYNKN